jgi:hypothetical protein
MNELLNKNKDQRMGMAAMLSHPLFYKQYKQFPQQYKVILSLRCSVISVAFYYLCGYFSLLMPYWL